MASYPLIDIYCHIYPEAFFQEMTKVSPQTENLGKRLRTITKLFDLDPSASARWTRSATTGRSSRCPIRRSRTSRPVRPAPTSPASATTPWPSSCARHPDRFPGFVAAVSSTDVDGSSRRGLAGDYRARRLRHPDVHAARRPPARRARASRRCSRCIAAFDLPIWLHPARTAAMPDYPTEAKSRFEMWWCFGWPYDTSVAMSAPRVLRTVRSPSRDQDHHPPSAAA